MMRLLDNLQQYVSIALPVVFIADSPVPVAPKPLARPRVSQTCERPGTGFNIAVWKHHTASGVVHDPANGNDIGREYRHAGSHVVEQLIGNRVVPVVADAISEGAHVTLRVKAIYEFLVTPAMKSGMFFDTKLPGQRFVLAARTAFSDRVKLYTGRGRVPFMIGVNAPQQ